jgi:hypothetical protein
MQPTRWKFLLLAMGLSLIPHGAAASDELAAQMKAMQERMLQLEDRLEATSDQLQAANQRLGEQEEVIHKAGLGGTSSGLATFIESIEVGGWVSGTYFYNFNNPDGRALAGANTGLVPAFPFKPDANSFAVDQVWFELERAVGEENRAGFRLDFVWGKTGEILSGNTPDGRAGTGTDFHLYQAYVQYLAPIGNGVNFQFGKLATPHGAEVAMSPHNLNITRGHVYNLFQPITHMGITAATEFGGGFDGLVGFVNETRAFPARDIDLNKDKALVWSFGWAIDESWSTRTGGVWGSSDSGQGVDQPSGKKELILDWVVNFNPTERFTSYVNASYLESQASRRRLGSDQVKGYGISAAGRYALTDRLGLALRGEWVDLNFKFSRDDFQIWGITSTVDYALTSHLSLRGEVRYDNAKSSSPSNLFFKRDNALIGTGTKGDQVVAGVEVLYTF